MMKNFSRQSKICVLGAGSWGTALALYFATRFESVNLWSFDPKEAAKLQEVRENVDYLPGIPFPPNIDCLHNLSQAITENCVVVVAVPSHAFEETVAQLEPLKQQMVSVVIATKGVTQKGEFLHHQTQQVLGDFPIALLSGPSFAKEVALGMPSSLTLASEYPALLKQLKPMFHSEIFRIETTEDCVGVALGGLVKNVIAIAVGLSDGLGYGANARAALITRGVQEMQSITKAMSGQTKTVMGLAALGDLVLTTTDNQSRNRRFGLALGQGMSVAEAETHIGQVVEGKTNVKELMMLAKRYQLSLPICQQIFELICQGVPAQTVMKNILSV